MDQPIACTLAPDEFRDRTSDLAAIAARSLRARAPIPGGERLTFTGDDATDQELRAVVAAESRCCAFLEFDLRRDSEHLVLDVLGPEDARPLIAELFA